jgi:hypothetical protein
MRATISEPAAQHPYGSPHAPFSPAELFQVPIPAKPDVPSCRAALATETAGPRIRRSDDELKLERNFQLIAGRVLTTGENDGQLELERRADEDMLAVAGFKSIKTDKAR